MQQIASWTNLSETTFLLRPTVSEADYRLRTFTPRQELPFAGHSTIGSAYAAIEAGFVSRKDRLRQECGAGVLDLSIEDAGIFVKGPAAKIGAVPKPPFQLVSNPLRVDVGPIWVVGEVESARALALLKPDVAAIAAFSDSVEATGITLFASSDDCVAAMHVRSFAPAYGIPEDPVCGSGNLSVAAYLKHTSQLGRFGQRYVARQGAALGRDGRVMVRIEPDGIRIGGQAVTCIDGTLKA